MIDANFTSRAHSPTTHRHAGTSAVPPAVADSLNYQILRRTLMPDSPEPDVEAAARELSAAQQAPAAATQTQASASSTSLDLASTTTVQRQASNRQQTLEQRELNLEVQSPQPPAKSDPLVLDLAGNGFSTRGLHDALRFDLNGDGRQELISAPAGDDALLALDANHNGAIDSGNELFGDQHGASNGFVELARYDGNQDGRIDAEDQVYQQLSLLRFDAQGRQHQQSLSEAGVSAIELAAQNVKQALGAYDEVAQLGRFEFADGRQGQAADLLLARRDT